MSLENKQFNFLLWMTGIVVLIFVGAALYAFITGKISWQIYAASMTPIATGFAGYWLGGKQ